MPSWGILKTKKKERSAAHKVHFQLGGSQDTDNRSRSSSVESDASDQHLPALGHDLPRVSSHSQLDLSHGDVEDEGERQCLRHLDKLGLSLEKTFKEVESIDAYVKKLRHDFNHEILPEKRYMSCMCSAKIARAACCKKQIELWQQLQHDIQESSCHHHSLSPEGPIPQCHDSLADRSSDSMSSISTTSSQDTSDADVIISHLSKMVLFDVIRHRLDPTADCRTFVDQWILTGHHSDSENNNHFGQPHTVPAQS